MSHQDYILKMFGLEDKNIIFSKKLQKAWQALMYEQVGRRKLVHDTIRYGRFTIIVSRGIVAFISKVIRRFINCALYWLFSTRYNDCSTLLALFNEGNI